jgi:hypothetical protein
MNKFFENLTIKKTETALCSVPKTLSRIGFTVENKFAMKQPRTIPGANTGFKNARSVMASESRNWISPYCGTGEKMVRAAYIAAVRLIIIIFFVSKFFKIIPPCFFILKDG